MTSPLQGEDRRFNSAPAHHSHRRRKALGQHFLIDENIADRIVAVAEIRPGERILEIGPGRGVLTERLAPLGRLTAIEKDHWLAVVLQQRFAAPASAAAPAGEVPATPTGDAAAATDGGGATGDDRVALPRAEIIHGDALEVALPPVDVVVANLPYAISSPLLFRLFTAEWKRAVLMFQEEFAVRLTAPPGSRDYGRLSVMAQHRVACRRLFRVTRNAFLPPPRVHSLMVRLDRREPNYTVDDFALFERMVATLFSHRRKTVRNGLRQGFPELEPDGLPHLTARAEALTPAELAALANAVGARLTARSAARPV